jgi:hypothetical protein
MTHSQYFEDAAIRAQLCNKCEWLLEGLSHLVYVQLAFTALIEAVFEEKA